MNNDELSREELEEKKREAVEWYWEHRKDMQMEMRLEQADMVRKERRENETNE